MKAVLDTNMFISSFYGGNPKKVIDRWKDGKLILCLSAEILEEYTEVLGRMGLEGEEEMEELLTFLGKGVNVLFTKKTPHLSIVKDDPGDDKFIECAIALKANCIITGDKALKAVGQYKEIKILSPKEFLKSL